MAKATLVRKKIKVHRKGRTILQSRMVRSGSLKDNPHVASRHAIEIKYNKATPAQESQARQAISAIHKAHTHGRTPGAFVARVGKGGIFQPSQSHGHGVVMAYGHHVAGANRETFKKFHSKQGLAGVMTERSRRLHEAAERAVQKDRSKSGHADWAAFRASGYQSQHLQFSHAYTAWVGSKSRKAKIDPFVADRELGESAHTHGVPVGYNRSEMHHINRFFNHEFGGEK
jgi:hypothetical protein